MKMLAMLEVLATPAVESYPPAALVNTEMVVLFALFDPFEENIVVALTPFGQSNYVLDYPYEQIHWYDYHYDFQVGGSNSYYSLITFIYTVSFGPKNFTFIRLPV